MKNYKLKNLAVILSVSHTKKWNCMTAEKIPTKYEVETYWNKIWWAPIKTYNKNSSWLHKLEIKYCSDVQPKQFEITKDTLKTAVNKIYLRKSPGRSYK